MIHILWKCWRSKPHKNTQEVEFSVSHFEPILATVYVCVYLCIEGTQEVSCAVDEKSGDIVLSFESCQINEGSQFIWKKDYQEITDFSKGLVINTEGSQ